MAGSPDPAQALSLSPVNTGSQPDEMNRYSTKTAAPQASDSSIFFNMNLPNPHQNERQKVEKSGMF